MPQEKTKQLSQQIKAFARSIGIDLVGFAPARPDPQGQQMLENFLSQNRQGEMHYLEDAEKRTNPEKLLPGAKTVIVIAVNYYRESPPTPKQNGRIARYAYGRDYHKVIKKLLKQLEEYMATIAPDAACKPCVDTAPLLEKSYAVQAGLGFIGKNTTLITQEFGSWVLLGELLTTLELDYDKPQNGTCGTCTRCLDACPTKALIAPSQMNATRCISYLTIENRGPIPQEFHKSLQNLIFGCDICQEVCPYNKAFQKPLQLEAFQEVTIAGSGIPLEEILAIDSDEAFVKRFAGSPVMRAKRKGLQRNARVALNHGPSTSPQVSP